MAEILDFTKFRQCRAATGPNTFGGVRLPPLEAGLADAELNELNRIFPGVRHVEVSKATRRALFNEAFEQAHIEMNGGVIDTSNLPPLPIEGALPDAASQLKRVRELRLMVERTAQLLRDYLDAYKRLA